MCMQHSVYRLTSNRRTGVWSMIAIILLYVLGLGGLCVMGAASHSGDIPPSAGEEAAVAPVFRDWFKIAPGEAGQLIRTAPENRSIWLSEKRPEAFVYGAGREAALTSGVSGVYTFRMPGLLILIGILALSVGYAVHIRWLPNQDGGGMVPPPGGGVHS